jgi:hypothetical protein
MYQLYQQSFERLNTESYTDYTFDEEMNQYLIQKMEDLSILAKHLKPKQYCLRQKGILWGIDASKLIFQATSKYDLWLKVYHYFREHTDNIELFQSTFYNLRQLDQTFCESYEMGDADPMMYVIDEILKECEKKLEWKEV